MKTSKICPYIRVAMHDCPADFIFNRVIWDFEIIYIENGTLNLEIEGEKYVCSKGDIIFLRPGIPHILSSNTFCEQPHIHFDFIFDEYSEKIYVPLDLKKSAMTDEQKKWFRKDFLKENDINLPYVIRLNNSYNIRELLYQIIEEFNYDYPYSEFELPALLTKLFVELCRSYDNQVNNTYGKHQQTINKLVKYIQQNINKQITLDELSEYVHISKFYLIRIFSQTFNVTPQKYIANIRLKRAKELIQFSQKSLKEISLEMNFNTQQSFTRWFKKIDGKSPSYYRLGK